MGDALLDDALLSHWGEWRSVVIHTVAHTHFLNDQVTQALDADWDNIGMDRFSHQQHQCIFDKLITHPSGPYNYGKSLKPLPMSINSSKTSS